VNRKGVRREDLETRTRGVWRAARYTSLGLELAASIVLGVMGGSWLDGRFDWSPWGTLAGFVVGLGAATTALIRATRRAQREMSEDEDERRGADDDPDDRP